MPKLIIKNIATVESSTNKKAPFAVKINDAGQNKLYVKKFRRLLNQFELVRNPNNKLPMTNLRDGDLIVFGSSSKYDYTVITKEEIMVKLSASKVLHLVNQYDEVVEALERYIDRNDVPSKSDKFTVLFKESWLPRKKKVTKVEDNVKINFRIKVTEEPEEVKPVTTFDVVDFFDTFVRIGWNIYDIYVEPYSGNEYVAINGSTYQIKKHFFGFKYLSKVSR